MTEELSQSTAEVRKREIQVMEMLNAEYTTEEIRVALGYADNSSIRHIRRRVLQRHLSKAVNEYRAEDLARLDKLIQTLYPMARRGDLAATDRLLKVLDSRARLTGTNAPTRIEADLTSGMDIDQQIVNLLEAARHDMEAEESASITESPTPPSNT